MWSALCTAAILACCHLTCAEDAHKDDIHGGVPMGVLNKVCDDGKTRLEVDWDPHSKIEYTCYRPISAPANKNLTHYHCDDVAQRPVHRCMNTDLSYTDDLPTSGEHRPIWPVYGEYKYVPPQRWLHNLEHGGLVFLYNPCADTTQVNMFKSVARGCLRRHVIAAYKKLPPEMNFAVLAWRCKLVMSDVDIKLMQDFVKARALKGPERVAADGQYSAGLKAQAKVVSDYKDSKICPQILSLADPMHQVQKWSRSRQNEYSRARRMLTSLLQGTRHHSQ